MPINSTTESVLIVKLMFTTVVGGMISTTRERQLLKNGLTSLGPLMAPIRSSLSMGSRPPEVVEAPWQDMLCQSLLVVTVVMQLILLDRALTV